MKKESKKIGSNIMPKTPPVFVRLIAELFSDSVDVVLLKVVEVEEGLLGQSENNSGSKSSNRVPFQQTPPKTIVSRW